MTDRLVISELTLNQAPAVNVGGLPLRPGRMTVEFTVIELNGTVVSHRYEVARGDPVTIRPATPAELDLAHEVHDVYARFSST